MEYSVSKMVDGVAVRYDGVGADEALCLSQKTKSPEHIPLFSWLQQAEYRWFSLGLIEQPAD